MGIWQIGANSEKNGINRSQDVHFPTAGKVLRFFYRPRSQAVALNIQKACFLAYSKSGYFPEDDKEKRAIRYNQGNNLSLTNFLRSKYGNSPDVDTIKLTTANNPVYTDCATFAQVVAEMAIGKRLGSVSNDTRHFENAFISNLAFRQEFEMVAVDEDWKRWFKRTYPTIGINEDWEQKYRDKWQSGIGFKVGDILLARTVADGSSGYGHAYMIVDTDGTITSFDGVFNGATNHLFHNIIVNLGEKQRNRYVYTGTNKNINTFGQASSTNITDSPDIRLAFITGKGEPVQYASAVYCIDENKKIQTIKYHGDDINTVFVGDSRICQIRKFNKNIEQDSKHPDDKPKFMDYYPTRNVFATWGGRLFNTFKRYPHPDDIRSDTSAGTNTRNASKMLSSKITNIVFSLGINDVEYEYLWERRRKAYERASLNNPPEGQPGHKEEEDLDYYSYRKFERHTAQDYADRLQSLATLALRENQTANVYICSVIDSRELTAGDKDTANAFRGNGQTEFIIQINNEIAKMCASNGFTYLDFRCGSNYQQQPGDYWGGADMIHFKRQWFDSTFKPKMSFVGGVGGDEQIVQEFPIYSAEGFKAYAGVNASGKWLTPEEWSIATTSNIKGISPDADCVRGWQSYLYKKLRETELPSGNILGWDTLAPFYEIALMQAKQESGWNVYSNYPKTKVSSKINGVATYDCGLLQYKDYYWDQSHEAITIYDPYAQIDSYAPGLADCFNSSAALKKYNTAESFLNYLISKHYTGANQMKDGKLIVADINEKYVQAVKSRESEILPEDEARANGYIN